MITIANNNNIYNNKNDSNQKHNNNNYNNEPNLYNILSDRKCYFFITFTNTALKIIC